MYTLEQLRAWQAFTQTQQGMGMAAPKEFIKILTDQFGCTNAQARDIMDALFELDSKQQKRR